MIVTSSLRLQQAAKLVRYTGRDTGFSGISKPRIQRIGEPKYTRPLLWRATVVCTTPMATLSAVAGGAFAGLLCCRNSLNGQKVRKSLLSFALFLAVRGSFLPILQEFAKLVTLVRRKKFFGLGCGQARMCIQHNKNTGLHCSDLSNENGWCSEMVKYFPGLQVTRTR